MSNTTPSLSTRSLGERRHLIGHGRRFGADAGGADGASGGSGCGNLAELDNWLDRLLDATRLEDVIGG